jgi:predicted NAD/FAD-binding protein
MASSSGMGRKKVAVIGGGGAGLCTAYLIEEHFDVTIFEALERVGGHADTVEVVSKKDGKTVIAEVDAGADFVSLILGLFEAFVCLRFCWLSEIKF